MTKNVLGQWTSKIPIARLRERRREEGTDFSGSAAFDGSVCAAGEQFFLQAGVRLRIASVQFSFALGEAT